MTFMPGLKPRPHHLVFRVVKDQQGQDRELPIQLYDDEHSSDAQEHLAALQTSGVTDVYLKTIEWWT